MYLIIVALEKFLDLKILMLSLLYSIGFFGNSIAQMYTAESRWIDFILGPLGALFLSVVALYFLWNYMRKKDALIAKIREEQLSEKNKEIEELRKQVKELMKK